MSLSSSLLPAGVPQTLADAAEQGWLAGAYRFARHHPRVTGSILFLLTIWLISVCAPLLAPYSPYTLHTHNLTEAPSRAHLMGTDELGRDSLTRVLYGGRISMIVALVVVALSSSIGITMGLVGGYFGGAIDQLFGRITDAVLSFPPLLLILSAVAAFGQSLKNVMIVIGLIGFPVYYRLTRGQVLQAREFEYVTAARAMGARPVRLLLRHILPNIANPLIIWTSIVAGGAILAEATVSFLGIGAQPPEAEWGSMFNKALADFRLHPWLIFGPGTAVFLTVLAYYMLGDALRDALDPRLRGRQP